MIFYQPLEKEIKELGSPNTLHLAKKTFNKHVLYTVVQAVESDFISITLTFGSFNYISKLNLNEWESGVLMK